LSVDLRDGDDVKLREAEMQLTDYCEALQEDLGVRITSDRLVRFEPVRFDEYLVSLIERAAVERGVSVCRMTSGAGHDAQMLARVAPSAMIFVPSVDGISHSPRERTNDVDLIAGANVLLDVVSVASSSRMNGIRQCEKRRQPCSVAPGA